MEKVTIIIPIYNVEKYVGEAIESVMNQTYKNIEIILVDDGSTDRSGEICDEYQKKDDRIKVIHQENGGLPIARNAGLENATGKYIMFLDSDDILVQNACEAMYNKIEEKNADYVVGNYINMDEDGRDWDKPIFPFEKYQETELSIKDYKKSFFLMSSSVCNKIFRKSFIDGLNLKFTEKIPAEDAVFTTYCFIKSKCVYYIPSLVFRYRQRYKGSISNSCTKEYFDGINKAYRMIYENFRDNDELEYYKYFQAKSMNYILYKFIDSNSINHEEKIQILNNMQWFYILGLEGGVSLAKPVKYTIEAIKDGDYEQALKYCDMLNSIREMLPKELKEKMSKPNANAYMQKN